MEETIRRLKDNGDFKTFEKYILNQIEELDSVNGLEKLSNEQAGEEAKVRLKAKEKLYDIIRPFIEFGERKEPSADEIQKVKSRFAL